MAIFSTHSFSIAFFWWSTTQLGNVLANRFVSPCVVFEVTIIIIIIIIIIINQLLHRFTISDWPIEVSLQSVYLCLGPRPASSFTTCFSLSIIIVDTCCLLFDPLKRSFMVQCVVILPGKTKCVLWFNNGVCVCLWHYWMRPPCTSRVFLDCYFLFKLLTMCTLQNSKFDSLLGAILHDVAQWHAAAICMHGGLCHTGWDSRHSTQSRASISIGKLLFLCFCLDVLFIQWNGFASSEN